MAEEFQIGDRAGLAALLRDRSDAEITEAVGATADAVLDQVFDGMRQAFVPERAGGQSAVVQWDITAPDGARTYQMRIADGCCAVERGAGGQPRVALGLALPDFLRFVAGELDGMQAFMTGKLRLSGDMLFAQSMQAWFDQ